MVYSVPRGFCFREKKASRWIVRGWLILRGGIIFRLLPLNTTYYRYHTTTTGTESTPRRAGRAGWRIRVELSFSREISFQMKAALAVDCTSSRQP